MNEIIKKYYENIDMIPVIVQQNLEKLERNPDIAEEFEYWIQNKMYNQENVVTVEGYTAESISKLSRYLEGESSFMLLIELRENPDRARKRIKKGFKVK